MNPSSRTDPSLAPRDQTTVLIVTALAGFLATFMGSSINIALPLIGLEFQASAVTLSWISLTYILAAGAVLMPVGRIADLYGRKRVFVWGMLVFAVVAFASGLSPSAPVLIVLRVVQGLGATLVFATGTAMVSLAYPPETRGRALGLNVAGTFFQTAFSPVAGRLSDHVEARWVASSGMALCTLGLLAFVFLGQETPYWYIIATLSMMGLGFAFFASPITHSVMGSVDKRYYGVASATLGTMRLAGQNISLGIATLVLAIVVGRHVIEPADYPNLLTSVRICFAIFTCLCVVGVAASLAGPGRGERAPIAAEGPAP